MLPLLSLLLLLFFFLSSTTLSSSLKLPLIPSLPFPTPQQALILDSIRLSSSSPPNSLSAPIVSAASSGAGQYLVELHLGSPKQLLRLVADTGSDLLWSRCSPCLRHCRLRHHHRRKPSFFPRHSASFAPFHCYHPSCTLLSPYSYNCRNYSTAHTPCRYRYSYADRSSSAGFFSRETASFDVDAAEKISFGCAFNVSGGAAFNAAHGVLGLGRGPISFASQAGNRFGNKFSYCLMDYTLSPPPTSYLLFGAEAINSSLTATTGLRFTPLQYNPLSPTFYYVRIMGASVDGIRLPIPPSVWAIDRASGNGGTIVDSGTTLTFLPEPAYRIIMEAMESKLPSTLVAGPPGFDLCVDYSTTNRIRLPSLSFLLLGGAEYSPPPSNYFTEVAEGVKCLALQPVGATGQGFAVIGNLMQQGFVFVFDRDESRLGFSHTGCT